MPFMQPIEHPAVDMDLSSAGVAWAWEIAYKKSGREPNLLLVQPRDYHLAEKIICGLPLTMRCIQVLVDDALIDGWIAWALGNINRPFDWAGSRGA